MTEKKQYIRKYLDDFIDYTHYRVNAPRIIATIDVPIKQIHKRC